MAIPRRFLPSLSLLSAFETAARHNSFTAAAEELAISQSAVSHQIRALEKQLGCELFIRNRQTVRLSPAGEAYADDIREALRRIGTASMNLHANPLGGTLSLAILPTFGTRWLAPRLPRFLDACPGITLNLATRLAPFDFGTDTMQAAIHFGEEPWPGSEGVELMRETVVPVCSPAFLAQHQPETPADLARMPLLHLSTRPRQWQRWLAQQGVETGYVQSMSFDQFATAAQAAASGLGIALLPEFLIRNDLDRGDLVLASDHFMLSSERYFLVWPRGERERGPLVAFRNWILAEVAKA